MKYVFHGKEQARPELPPKSKQTKRKIHDGVPYFAVPDAARLLGTTTPKVREMMGNGGLEWMQFKENGKLFVSGRSIAEKMRSMAAKENT